MAVSTRWRLSATSLSPGGAANLSPWLTFPRCSLLMPSALFLALHRADAAATIYDKEEVLQLLATFAVFMIPTTRSDLLGRATFPCAAEAARNVNIGPIASRYRSSYCRDRGRRPSGLRHSCAIRPGRVILAVAGDRAPSASMSRVFSIRHWRNSRAGPARVTTTSILPAWAPTCSCCRLRLPHRGLAASRARRSPLS